MNNWLPKDYKRPEPQGGSYLKFQDGQNKFRILSEPIMGFEYWTMEKKPVRSRTPFDGVPNDAKLEDGKFKPKHFWAFVVWNYAVNAVQIMEITQASIQGPIQDYAMNEDWGDPRNYDITIKKSGEGLETEYSVMPSAPKTLAGEIAEAYAKTPVRLEALFDGEDPFTVKDVVTDEDRPF